MYLARREFGKQLRVYAVKTAETPSAWPFHCDYTDSLGFKLYTKAAVRAQAVDGVAATGYTRAQALANLSLAEEAGIDEITAFVEYSNDR